MRIAYHSIYEIFDCRASSRSRQIRRSSFGAKVKGAYPCAHAFVRRRALRPAGATARRDGGMRREGGRGRCIVNRPIKAA